MQGISGEVFWVILHSEQSTKTPLKFCPIFRPASHQAVLQGVAFTGVQVFKVEKAHCAA